MINHFTMKPYVYTELSVNTITDYLGRDYFGPLDEDGLWLKSFEL